jgi:thiamine biosynthesis protein ThiI
MKNVLLVKYGEIATRGNNRYLVENRLIKTIIGRLADLETYRVYKEQGRLLVVNEGGEFDYDEVIPRVVTTLGVTAVCPCVEVEDQALENLRQVGLSEFKRQYPTGNLTFKVETKRSDKKYPHTSNEVSASVGGFILHSDIPGLSVDVHNPDAVLHVELRNNAYIYCKFIKAFGGLPMGSSGKATVLMSGGIDSPVAAFNIAKRGVEIEAVYFDSPPYTSERAKQKVVDLAKRLAVFTGGVKLYVVPFTETQLKIYESVPPEKITIFLKRAMLKAAEAIALESNSLALVTGDSIGQVASQTMEAVNAIDSAVTQMPVLRPLCAMDKQEIVDIARKIGTFDISIRPYEDCCTVFVPKHPETKPKKSIIEKMERGRLEGIDELIKKAVENKEIIEC